MNQQQWNLLFENKFVHQPSVLDFMEKEVALMKKVGKEFNLEISNFQAISLWEHYSDSMDASWLFGTEDKIRTVIKKFINNPSKFWDYALYEE